MTSAARQTVLSFMAQQSSTASGSDSRSTQTVSSPVSPTEAAAKLVAGLITDAAINGYTNGKVETRASISHAFLNVDTATAASLSTYSAQMRAVAQKSSEKQLASVARQLHTKWSVQQQALGRTDSSLNDYKEALSDRDRDGDDDRELSNGRIDSVEGRMTIAARAKAREATARTVGDLSVYANMSAASTGRSVSLPDIRAINTPYGLSTAVRQFQSSGGRVAVPLASLGVWSADADSTMKRVLADWAVEVVATCKVLSSAISAEYLSKTRAGAEDIKSMNTVIARVKPVTAAIMQTRLAAEVDSFRKYIATWPSEVVVTVDALRAAVNIASLSGRQQPSRDSYYALLKVIHRKCDTDKAIDNTPTVMYKWLEENVVEGRAFERVNARTDVAFMKPFNVIGEAHIKSGDAHRLANSDDAAQFASMDNVIDAARAAFICYCITRTQSPTDPLAVYVNSHLERYAERKSNVVSEPVWSPEESKFESDAMEEVAAVAAAEAVVETVSFPADLLTDRQRSAFLMDVMDQVDLRVAEAKEVIADVAAACSSIVRWAAAKRAAIQSSMNHTPLVKETGEQLNALLSWMERANGLDLGPLSKHLQSAMDSLRIAMADERKVGTESLRVLATVVYNSLDKLTKDATPAVIGSGNTHSLTSTRVSHNRGLLVQVAAATCIGAIYTSLLVQGDRL